MFYVLKENLLLLLLSLQIFFKKESHTFTAAVRGYHYYRRFWRPKENEKLICLYEAGNPFDRCAVKTVNESGEILGHLPKEMSGVTKVFLKSRSLYVLQVVFRALSSFPLVQGGLEIECELVINSQATMLQSRLTARYLDLVNDLYTEPAEDRVVGNLFNFAMTLPRW